MTRINVGIPPSELHDKHLLAEHREIKRIPNMITSGKAVIKDIPKEFTLGKGHVKFFYDKVGYLHLRYDRIYDECIKRGFDVTHYSAPFYLVATERPDLYKLWTPTPEAKALIRERIAQKLLTMKPQK